MEQLYTTKSLAALLQVSPSTIRREITEGRISWFKVRGQIRFKDSDVQKYLNQGQWKRRKLGSAEVVYMSTGQRKPAISGT
jgi:excisionase family DNA binding protein